MVKNLKNGLKVSKRDVVLNTSFSVVFDKFPCRVFSTKLDAVNFISEYLFYHPDEKDKFSLIKVQSLKF